MIRSKGQIEAQPHAAAMPRGDGWNPADAERLMDTYLQQIQVGFQYRVHFTMDAFRPGHGLIRSIIDEGRDALFYIEKPVLKAHPHVKDFIEGELGKPLFQVGGGEKVKGSMATIKAVGRHIRQAGLCRHSSIVMIGGGAMLDAIGFAAGITHRGMRQIRVPTTVLSQNDSGVGVKNGINAFGAKNFFGTFTPPHAVVNDASFLTTLDRRDWCSGISEAFKVSIIKDIDFLRELCAQGPSLRGRDMAAMQKLIHRCAILHMDHIREGGDPFEFGSSRPLDFGHWSAHKLEMLTRNQVRHGEAVAIGVALDLVIARNLGFISQDELLMILVAMDSCGLPLWHPKLEDPLLIEGIREFREHIGGQLCLTMPDGLGRKREIHELEESLVAASREQLKQLLAGKLPGQLTGELMR